MKKVKVVLATLSLLLILAACSSQNKDEGSDAKSDGALVQSSESNPVVKIEMQNNDVMMIELYPEVAPNTVSNFIELIEEGFYDGVMFHRIIPGFMIQGGDPEGTGMGGPGYSIMGEFSNNGFENNLKHERGVISMARSQQNDSAGSQFFIIDELAPHLDKDYAAFGVVIEGLDTLDAIVSVDTDKNDRPLAGQEQIMKKVTVDLKGETYSKANKLN